MTDNILISGLTEKTQTGSDDYFIIGSSDAKKISSANLKKEFESSLYAGAVGTSLKNSTVKTTGERLIGTYNGANVYEQIIETKMTSFVSGTSFATIEISMSTTPGKVLSVENTIYGDNSTYSLPYFSWEGAVNTFFWNVAGTKLKFRNKAAWGANYTLVTTVRYLR